MSPATATAEAGNPAPDTPGTPATCEIRDWLVFAPGCHKGELYTAERCRTQGANFERLRGKLIPTVKIGHDKSQRLAKSLGFLNAGRIVEVKTGPDGGTRLTLTGIPTRVGAQVNAGRLNSGSVELKAAVPDPADPGKKLPGDVIVAVALLGEEQPALPGYAAPRAVFADGTEVPPADDADDWLAAMAGVVTTMAAESRDAEDPTTVICFSEMSPMTRDQLIQALKAKGIDVAADPKLSAAPDDELKRMLDNVTESGFSDGLRKHFSADPGAGGGAAKAPAEDKAPAWFTAYSEKSDKAFADLTGRVGAMEAAKTADQDAAAKEKDAAFSAEVTRVVEDAARRGTIQPWQKAAFATHGKSLDRTKTFSDGPDKGKTEFAAWRDKLLSGAADKMFSDAVADGPKPGANAVYNPFLAAAVRPGGVYDRHAPAGAKAIRESA